MGLLGISSNIYLNSLYQRQLATQLQNPIQSPSGQDTSDKPDISQGELPKIAEDRIAAIRASRKEIYRARLAEVWAHEQAHGCNFTGPIVIEDNVDHVNYTNPTNIGGHRSVSMPSLDPSNPEQTINNANEIYHSALAPDSNLSAADYHTASAALALKAQAEQVQAKQKQSPGNRLNLMG